MMLNSLFCIVISHDISFFPPLPFIFISLACHHMSGKDARWWYHFKFEVDNVFSHPVITCGEIKRSLPLNLIPAILLPSWQKPRMLDPSESDPHTLLWSMEGSGMFGCVSIWLTHSFFLCRGWWNLERVQLSNRWSKLQPPFCHPSFVMFKITQDVSDSSV